MKAMQPIKPNERAANILGILAMIAVLLVALALLGTSLFASARINPEQYVLLKIDLLQENPWINALFAAAGIAIIILLGKIPVSKRFNTIFGILVLGMLALIGLVWVRSVKAFAESDGDVLIRIAERIIANDYTSVAKSGEYLHYYMVRFPYQCGLLSCLEVLVRLFGSTNALLLARVCNVGLLVSSYAALLMTTQRLFQDDRVTFVTILLLCVNPQPILSCTFVYGLIPALALDLWAVYFVVRAVQTNRWRNMVPTILLLAAATYLRSNTWIVIVAVAVILSLSALRGKKLAPLLLAVVLIAACLPLPGMAQTFYEERLDTSFGKGYPKSYWMAMSLQKGWKATGWHVQEYQQSMEQQYGEDVDAIDMRARQDIQASVSALFRDSKALSNYLFEKLVSQWDEPTFMSIWITKSVYTYAEPTALARFVYSDAFDGVYRLAMKQSLMTLYAGFALAAVFLLRRRDELCLLLPLILVGGILFHLLFEAKSQYVLEYLPFFTPLAAYGALSFGQFLSGLAHRKAEIASEPDAKPDGDVVA